MNDLFLQLSLMTVLLTAAVTDMRSCRIPNWLTVPAMICGLVLHATLDGQKGFILSLEGLAVGLLLFLILYATAGMGAGDVKLMAAVGSFLGPIGVLYAGVGTVLLGGIYAAATMVAHYGWRDSILRMWALFTTLSLPEEMADQATTPGSHYKLRYATVIGLGTVLSLIVVVR